MKKEEFSRLRVVSQQSNRVFVEKVKASLVVECKMCRSKSRWSKALVGVEESVSSDGIVEILGTIWDGREWPRVKCDTLVFASCLDGEEAEVAIVGSAAWF